MMQISDLPRRLRERHDAVLREMYTGARGNGVARAFARFWARAFSSGVVSGKRWVTLEVPGRRSGRTTRFPLGMATAGGETYLASMLGNECNWVRNVRANNGYAVIRRRGARKVQLIEVPFEARPPLLKTYVQQVPGARPHIPVAPHQPVADFVKIAADYPVFRVEPDTR